MPLGKLSPSASLCIYCQILNAHHFHEDRNVAWRIAALNLADESYFVFWY